MDEKVDKVYGPRTLQFARFGRLTSLWLRLFVWTTYVHESPQGIVVYKKIGNTMYVLAVCRKQSQADIPERS